MTARGAPNQCPGCLEPIAVDSQRLAHRSGYNNQNYTLHHCRSCALEFWWPLKVEPSFYEDDGFAAYKEYHSGSRPFPRWALPLFRTLPATRGRSLDIGCGDGSVLQKLKRAGFEPYGIDLDKKSIEAARHKYGLTTVVTATLEDFVSECRTKHSKFELVTFFEVLEHQDNPRRFLEQVIEILAPNGVIAGSVPNRDRFLSHLDRLVGTGDLPPHHFLWFSTRALLKLLRQMGLSDIQVITTGVLSFPEIAKKTTRLIFEKSSTLPMSVRLITLMLLVPIVPFISILLWLGMRLKPSHLYFQATARKSQIL